MCWYLDQNLGKMRSKYPSDAGKVTSNELSISDNHSNSQVFVKIATASEIKHGRKGFKDQEGLLVIEKKAE